MPNSIEDTLQTIDTWFKETMESTADADRPNLLSKLALLELCGWIEGKFDEIVIHVNSLTICDEILTQKVIRATSGFEYDTHLRRMLINYLGEHNLRKLEADYEDDQKSTIEHFKSTLGTLWKKRCSLAHADLVTNIATQNSIDAPSWTISQYKSISKMIERYKATIDRRLKNQPDLHN